MAEFLLNEIENLLNEDILGNERIIIEKISEICATPTIPTWMKQ